ncbi:MAG TPA: Ig-like domain-containing protein, partial [Hyphomicrobiales bacterium]|nr:Ig-like domain-containing protein [Hyphomicrobiales bacterium]
DGSPLPAWLTADTVALRLIGVPPADFNGVLDIRVAASDGQASVSDVFHLTIRPVNDAPHVAEPLPNQPLPGELLFTGDPFTIDIPASTFADVDGDPLAFAALQADGTPLPDWMSFDGETISGVAPHTAVGTYEIEIRATDGLLVTSDVFLINFSAGNQAPTAVADGPFETRPGVPLEIFASQLLGNDSDPDGDAISIAGVANGAHGTAELTGEGVVVYTAESGFSGQDQFVYTVTDGEDTAEALVTVNVGATFQDVATGGEGTDFLFGGRGDSFLNGGDGSDFLFAGRGNDVLRGGAGNDFLFGGRGNDDLGGGDGNDFIFGGNGNDRISGGRGNDTLFGGRGTDTFVFSTGDGADSIMDFETPRAGRRFTIAGDTIALNVEGIDSFDDVLAVAQQVRGGVVLDFGNGDELFLAGTRLSALDEDSFTFF